MTDTGIKPEVLSEIKEIAQRHGIKNIILFGSRARGDYYHASDIDIAVLGGDVAGFVLDIEEETSTLLEYDIIDLAKPIADELRASIEREGKVIYEKI